jgi:ParB family transcriptional regulator, chromosome partitioning protein
MQNQTTQGAEYRNVAIEQLEESPTNPRKRFNETSLRELAESFKSQGVLQPLVVRTKNGDASKYEVIAGARRLRAAQLAELRAVPVRIVELSDSDAVLAQVTENLQREDIHPLEEAFGFRSLLNLNDPNYTIATLAAKAGKSEGYVQGRIKLTELIAPIADAFLADKITIGHALLIAKLPAAQQQTAFNACFRQMWTGGVLNKVNATNVLALQNSQDTNKLLVALLEQQTIVAKQLRDQAAVITSADLARRTATVPLGQQLTSGIGQTLSTYQLP